MPAEPTSPTAPVVAEDPQRTCVGCRATTDTDALERFVLVEGHGLLLDLRRKAPGRGAWVHPTRACIEGALRGGFARSFRQAIPSAPSVDELQRGLIDGMGRRLAETFGAGLRAGLLGVGSVAVTQAMADDEAEVVFIAADAGGATDQKVRRNCERKQIAVVDSIDGGQLGRWTGRDFVSVVSLRGFAAERALRDAERLAVLDSTNPDPGDGR